MRSHGTSPSAAVRAIVAAMRKNAPWAEALEQRTFLAVHTWTGAANNNWSNAGNWVGGAPAVGESDVIVVFNTRDSTVTQNIAGLTIHQVLFNIGSSIVLTLNRSLTIDLDNAQHPERRSRAGAN